MDAIDVEGLAKRFDEKWIPEPNSGCWIWTAYANAHGYGCMSSGRRRGETWLAHRISWFLHKGIPAEGLSVCHGCDNTFCVNPDHLFLGTHRQNMQDCYRKGRDNGTAKRRGAEHFTSKFTEADVLAIRRSGPGSRGLARRFGVSRRTIANVLNRKHWKDVP